MQKLFTTLLCFTSFFVWSKPYGIIPPEGDPIKDSTKTMVSYHSTSVTINEHTNGEYIQIPEYNENTINTNSIYSSSISAFQYTNEVNKDKQDGINTFEKIEQDKKWVDKISPEELVELPIGIQHTKGGSYGSGDNVEYAIGVLKAKFTPQYTQLTVFARIKLPQTDPQGNPITLFFGANDVKLSHDGGIVGEAKLSLLGDLNIPFNNGNWMLSLHGGLNMQTGNTTDLTYAVIDCDGVKEISLDGSVVFSRNMIVPAVDYQPAEGNVKGDFKIKVKSWNDLLVELNINQSFMLAKQAKESEKSSQAFIFNVTNATFDFSDFRNGKTKFPTYYHEQGLLMPNENAWRGVSIETIEVALPRVFKKSDNKNRPIIIGAHDLLIDNYGLSGDIYADNVFPLDKGITGEKKAWAYSLDHIGVSLAASKLIKADFNGKIVLPVSKQDKKMALGYAGIISEEEYLLKVSAADDLDFDIWKAKARIEKNSYVELLVKDNEFKPKAVLSGALAITASQRETIQEGKSLVDFKGIRFQQLTLQTEVPILTAEYFGYNDEVKFANFPVSISDIGLRLTKEHADLMFKLNIGIMDSKDKGPAVTGGMAVLGKFEEENNRQKWKFKGLDIDEFDIKAKFAKIGFSGKLKVFDDDVIYDKGFIAHLTLDMLDVEGLTEAKGMFGSKEGMKYFYVDFISVLPKSIPIAPPVGINSIGGGFSYNMKRISYKEEELSESEKWGKGMSLSGIVYEPDSSKGLDLRAIAFLSIEESQALKGKVMLSMLFNKNGGLNEVDFSGYAEFMASFNVQASFSLTLNLSELKRQLGLPAFLQDKGDDKYKEIYVVEVKKEFVKSKIRGEIGIHYDFINHSLHGVSNIYVNLFDGMVKGIGAEDRAGWLEFHVDPKTWHFYLGIPEDRLGLQIGVGPIRVVSGSYFMVGDKIPGSPPPPPIVAQILGVDAKELDYMRDENALGEGKGFAFGTDFSLDTGDITFLFLYARFQAGAGFDIMLKDYGGATCSNRGGKELGVNGWYANGQAYAYLQGELGIKIKLFFIKKKIPIIRGGAAVLLQAKAPNPVWMKGYVGGHYNLLGGLIKGKFRFKLELGEKCEFANASPMGGIKMITSVAPKDGEGEVDVFAAPQATFAMRVNETILLPEDGGDKTYRVILERFEVKNEEGKTIDGKINWNRGKDVATFISTDILPPSKKLKASVEVSFQEQINGVFQTIMTEGKKAIELEERNFTTGSAPNVIPLQNIEYAYPVLDQKNFYREEYDKGYITLKRGQDYLFEDDKWDSEIVYKDKDGKTQKLTFAYDTAKNRLDYTLPDLDKEKPYTFSIISYPKGKQSEQSAAEPVVTTKTENADDDNTMETTTKEASVTTNTNASQIERLTYNFRTSKYKTFEQKMKALKVSDNQWGKIASDVIYLQSKINAEEPFDLTELVGSDYTQSVPLVDIEALLNDNYYKQDIATILYEKYPIEGQFYVDRDDKLKDQYEEPENIGIPPTRAVLVLNSYLTYLEQEIREDWLKTTFPYFYNLPQYYKADKVELENKIANFYADRPTQMGADALKVLQSPFLFMREGKYEVELRYQLPGGIKGSKAVIPFRNDLKFRPEESQGNIY